MGKPSRIFHGKVMLFGEYGVILNGQALTIPLKNFSAYLNFPGGEYDKDKSLLNQQLKDYLLALLRDRETTGIKFDIDLNAFAIDLLRGMYLDSNIPQGYGAGSSGALVAAIYHRYASRRVVLVSDPEGRELNLLQRRLARLEGYFHGTSSGIDPLSCYVAQPLLISYRKAPEPVSLPKPAFEKSGGFFLIDTFMPRKTDELVKLFLEKCRQPGFGQFIEKEYIPLAEHCINRLMVADWGLLISALRKLSEMQYQFFSEMIPRGFETLWRKGLTGDLFTLKLCGAGGGGFILGFTHDYEQTNKIISQAKSSIIPVEI